MPIHMRWFGVKLKNSDLKNSETGNWRKAERVKPFGLFLLFYKIKILLATLFFKLKSDDTDSKGD